MSIFDTIKGWLNIGGVKVALQLDNKQIACSGNEIAGSVELSSKGEKEILRLTYRFLTRHITGTGQARSVVDKIIAETVEEVPFKMTAGEIKTLRFAIPYVIPPEFYETGGVLGAVGKAGALVVNARRSWYVMAVCDVRGTALDPMSMVEVRLVE